MEQTQEQMTPEEVKASLGFGNMLLEQVLSAQNLQQEDEALPETPETAPEPQEIAEVEEMPTEQETPQEEPVKAEPALGDLGMLDKVVKTIKSEVETNYEKKFKELEQGIATDYENRIKDMEKKHKEEIKGVRDEIKKILNDQ